MSPVWSQPSRSSTSRRGRLVVPVAGEHLTALEQQLAVVGDPHGRARKRPANGADLESLGGVDGERRRGLGEPVALEHGQADATVEVAEPLAQRGATGDRIAAPAAEGRPEPAVDEPLEDRVLGADRERAPARGQSSPRDQAIAARRPGRRSAPALGGGVLAGGVEHLLEDAGHREHEGRLELTEVASQVGDVAGVAEAHPGLDRADLDDPGEHVGERQEEQRRGSSGANSSSSSSTATPISVISCRG